MKKDRDAILKEADDFLLNNPSHVANNSWTFYSVSLRGIMLCVKLLVRMNEHIEEEYDD